MKQALLVVSFGTSHQDTLEKTILAIEMALGKAFPQYTLRRAFTSGMIMRKLAKEGVVIDDVPTALTKLVQEGYTQVVIQPTHMMNGEEYEKMMDQAAPFVSRFQQTSFGKPLLTSKEDYQAVVEGLMGQLPAQVADTAIFFMGHGTTHFANSAYTQLDYMFHDLGRADVFVGTVEGYPEFPQLLNCLKKHQGIRRVLLYPLMIVAGDHAKNDLAGDEPDSWRSMLEAEGYEVESVLRGLGEFEPIQALFVAHAKEAQANG